MRFSFYLFLFLTVTLSIQGEDSRKKDIEEAFQKGDADRILSHWPDIVDLQADFSGQVVSLAEQPENKKIRRRVLAGELEEKKLILSDREVSKLLHLESDQLLKIKVHSEDDLKSIRVNLKVIEAKNLTANFYDVIPYTAFPLQEIRHEAYRVLSGMKDDRMYPIIMDMAVSEDSLERIYALDALYYIQDSRTVPILIKALGDENKSVRYYALRTLEAMKRYEVTPQFLRIIEKDKNNEVRIKAIQIVTSFRARNAVSTIERVLPDSDPGVRRESLLSLMEFKDKNAAYHISQQLERENIKDLKILEIRALILLESSGGMAGLNRIMKKEKDIEVLKWAVYAAGKLADFRGYSLVLENSEHKNPEIRAEAMLALGNYGKKEASSRMIEVVIDKKEEYSVKSAALEGLERLNDSGSFYEILKISRENEDDGIRVQAYEILERLLKKNYE